MNAEEEKETSALQGEEETRKGDTQKPLQSAPYQYLCLILSILIWIVQSIVPLHLWPWLGAEPGIALENPLRKIYCDTRIPLYSNASLSEKLFVIDKAKFEELEELSRQFQNDYWFLVVTRYIFCPFTFHGGLAAIILIVSLYECFISRYFKILHKQHKLQDGKTENRQLLKDELKEEICKFGIETCTYWFCLFSSITTIISLYIYRLVSFAFSCETRWSDTSLYILWTLGSNFIHYTIVLLLYAVISTAYLYLNVKTVKKFLYSLSPPLFLKLLLIIFIGHLVITGAILLVMGLICGKDVDLVIIFSCLSFAMISNGVSYFFQRRIRLRAENHEQRDFLTIAPVRKFFR